MLCTDTCDASSGGDSSVDGLDGLDGQSADRRRRTLLADETTSIKLTLILGTTPDAHSLDKLVTTITLANENAVDFGDDDNGGSFTTGEIQTADFPTTTTNAFDEFVETILADSEKKLQGGGESKKGKKGNHDHVHSKHSHSSKGKGKHSHSSKGKGTKSPKGTKGPKGNKQGGSARLQQAHTIKVRKEASAGVALVGIIGFVALIAVKKLRRDTAVDGEFDELFDERDALLGGQHAFAVPLEAAALQA